MSESINDLAFEIMHTEDLGTIHALANRIYLASLHDDLTVATPKSVDDFTNDEIITLLQSLSKQETTKTTENIYDKLFSESVKRRTFDTRGVKQMFGLSMFLMGLVSSIPILLYVAMSVDRSVSNRTIELETENDELWAIRYNNADKINELEEELAKVSIEKDRLEIKYKKLLGEN